MASARLNPVGRARTYLFQSGDLATWGEPGGRGLLVVPRARPETHSDDSAADRNRYLHVHRYRGLDEARPGAGARLRHAARAALRAHSRGLRWRRRRGRDGGRLVLRRVRDGGRRRRGRDPCRARVRRRAVGQWRRRQGPDRHPHRRSGAGGRRLRRHGRPSGRAHHVGRPRWPDPPVGGDASADQPRSAGGRDAQGPRRASPQGPAGARTALPGHGRGPRDGLPSAEVARRDPEQPAGSRVGTGRPDSRSSSCSGGSSRARRYACAP